MTGETMVTEMVVQMLPIRSIRRSPVNPRIVRNDDPKVAELAKNIGRVGLIQPITVRPVKAGVSEPCYEIIAGERRWRAYCHMSAEMTIDLQIPAFIRKMSDQDAHELTVTENMQRDDLSPIEEANGIQTLIQSGRGIEDIADRLGKPVSWVAKRANLVKLTEKIRTEIADPESRFFYWTVGHLEYIARYEPDVQDEIFARYRGKYYYGNQVPSIKELRAELERYCRKLSGACWNVTEEGPAGTGPCRKCDKRSGAQPSLFEEEQKEKKGDQCLDPKCWQRNVLAHLDKVAAELAAEHPVLFYMDMAEYNKRSVPDDSPYRKKLVESHHVDDAKKGSDGALPALIIDGPGQGTVKWVRLQLQYQERALATQSDGNKPPKSMVERREALEKRRNKALLERAKALLEDEIKEPQQALRLSTVEMYRFIGQSHLPRPYEWEDRGQVPENRLKGYIEKPDYSEGITDELRYIAIRLLRRALHQLQIEVQGSLNGWCKPDEAEFTYWLLGLDVEAAREEIRGEIKEPKSWADLNEDGTPKRKGE